LSDYERAVDYYQRIIRDDTPSSQDMLNYGHVLLCQGMTGEAIDAYRQALRKLDNNTTKFREAFKADAIELRLHGISAVDQSLIPDAVCAGITN
jgi:tetratricopeptide (TPR) repeat protein